MRGAFWASIWWICFKWVLKPLVEVLYASSLSQILHLATVWVSLRRKWFQTADLFPSEGFFQSAFSVIMAGDGPNPCLRIKLLDIPDDESKSRIGGKFTFYSWGQFRKQKKCTSIPFIANNLKSVCIELDTCYTGSLMPILQNNWQRNLQDTELYCATLTNNQ